MMTFRGMNRALLATSLMGLLAAGPAAHAQETTNNWSNWDHWSGWWYGIYGGLNINMFSGEIHNPGTNDVNVAAPNGFTDGMGLGLALGGILEYNPGKLLGGNLMVGYDNRSVDFDDVNVAGSTRSNEGLVAHLSYVTIEPNLRINTGLQLLHVMLGPSFRLLVQKGYDYSYTESNTSVTSVQDFANIRSFVIGAQAGVGYDIPLKDYTASSQLIITPFAQFHLGQDLLDVPSGSNDKFGMNTIRAGVQVKWGTAATAVAPTDAPPLADFVVRAPNVVTDSRRLNETFPIRNYVFFDAGSTEIPARYTKLSSGDAESFSESQLLKPSAETGGTDAMQIRSRRQMEVYYQVLNVFGDRLRRNPAATIKLTGSANGDAATGKKMAEQVRTYLTSTFGIDAKRISVEGRAQPSHRSGSGSSQGEDKKMIDGENYRVEIESNPEDLLRPVNITSVQEEPIDNDIVFTVPNRTDMTSWTVEITERGSSATQTFGPYSGTIARVDSKALLGSRSDARYTTRVIVATKDGQTISAPEREIRLVRADDGEEQIGNRYSILFEFDQSRTVQTYETFLSQTVAPAIPNGASVIIHGHTDVTGDPDYNQKLSQGRSEETQKILARELTKAGKSVTFDTYGFGEDERRSPFNNTLPEQRYYNRTVVVEVVPAR